MLSGSPRQQRIYSRKMNAHLLPFAYVQSMKNLGSRVRPDRKTSFLYSQTCVDESSMTITPKENPTFGKSPHKSSARFEQSDRYGYMDDQNENDTYDEFTSPYRSKSKQELQNRAKGRPEVSRSGNCLRNDHGLWVVVFLFLSLLFVCADCKTDNNQTDNQCALGLKTPGRTWPKGDIVLEYGQSLRIYCMLNETLTDPKVIGKNASDLIFFRNDKKMEPEYVTVLNSTTIMLYVETPVPSQDMYYCKLRLNDGPSNKYAAVCLNKVIVGFKPLKPLDFICISQNWENLTCTWYPAPNDIATHFSLGFSLPGRASRRVVFLCPSPKSQQNTSTPPPILPPNTCLWTASTDPMYRQVYEYYTFILSAENVLGNNSFIYKFHHWAHVIPSKPVNLSLISKTYSSAMMHWQIPYPMQTFPPGLHHKVSYASKYDPQTWESIQITQNPHNSSIYFNLTGLKYANTVYDIRVSMKSEKAVGENRWSKFNNITVKTAATLPGKPPVTDIGSFEIAEHSKGRDVYIYWQQIPAHLKNGDNFTYEIISFEGDGKRSDRQPSEKKDAYAKFKDISFESFKFEIVAANALGKSKQTATVYIPHYLEKPAEPVSFTKIAFEGGLYELSWNPTSDLSVVDYTIFWCENERDRPYQCNGYLDWVHVSRNVSIHNITVPHAEKIYQFAIAANTAHASSGMVWASCTAIHNKTIGKMKSVWINSIASDRIQVGWKLECSDRIDIIKGFVIYYCPIISPYNITCKDPEMNTTVKGGPHTMYGDVTGLKPYTTYRLTVAVLSKNGEGPHSDSLYNTTLEGAPTPPQNVNITSVTNTTITVEWKAPAATNGVLRYYTVYYNDNIVKTENITTLQIQGLDPYTDYSISVSAWTEKEGNRSEPKSQRTHIGMPGKPDIPQVRFNDTAQVHIVWHSPRIPGGNLDYYEIITGDDYVHTNITTCRTDCEEHLAVPDCRDAGRGKLYRFRVRAVNFGSNMERFEGPWSEPWEGNCFISGPSNVAWVVIWIIGCLSGVAFVMFLGYSSKRIWIKCKAMQDVEVKLPPGLQPNVKLLGKGNEQHTQQLSADSSGCSSGQESVTSSLTSDSHVSTDSGADLDPVPMSPTKLIESPPTWESTSLRQRNVSGSTKPDSSGDRERWNLYVKVDKTTDTPVADSHSLARSAPNLTDGSAVTTASGLYPASQQHAWPSTGYISMPSSEEDSSNNPSPLPRSKVSTQGVYSVVGLAPSLTLRARTGVEARDTERIHPRTADLIPFGPEAKKEPIAVNPYVSLASLEQNTRNAGSKSQIPSLRDFADMEIVHQFRDQQQNQPQPPPYSISDKLSKPYVQTGLVDTTKMLRPSTEHDNPNSDSQRAHYGVPAMAEASGGRPPFAQNFADPSLSLSQSLIELPSNIYVPVDTARGMPSTRSNQEPIQVQNPYVAVSTLVSPSGAPSLSNRQVVGDDDHSGSAYPFSPQLIETSNTKTQNLVDCDQLVTRSAISGPSTLPIVKQTSGYVTIASNPTKSTDNLTSEGSSMSYVPHQRVNKKSPPLGYEQNVGQTDEQYSKVTVVPTTT